MEYMLNALIPLK